MPQTEPEAVAEYGEQALQTAFSTALLAWFDRHGRKDLPWQQERTPYRVWISEIMLQQTRVETVIPYYHRFLARFPEIHSLAAASEDEVLQLWSGLGYYARARNLRRCAIALVEEHGGAFPETLEALTSLPGIGRSTAGAILSLALDQHQAILDGNVRRVLCRTHRIEGWPGQSQVAQRLWSLAEHLTPSERTADYNQAMMDLGATLCRRGTPHCPRCPLIRLCAAHRHGEQRTFPQPRPKRELPVKQAQLLMLFNPEGSLLLERRPSKGIWGGLWSLPECGWGEDAEVWCREQLQITVQRPEPLPVRRHTFSHYHLDYRPLRLQMTHAAPGWMDEERHLWYNSEAELVGGVASPVARLIEEIGLPMGR